MIRTQGRWLLADEQARIEQLSAARVPVREIARRLGVSRSTVIRYHVAARDARHNGRMTRP